MEAASFLLKKGVNVNIKNINGQTAIHSALWSGKVEMAELFIKNGADIKAKDVWGFPPLYWTNWEKDKKIVKLFSVQSR